MKFQVVALANAARDALELDRRQHAEKQAEWQAERDTKRDQWLAEVAPLWLDAFVNGRRKIRAGQPLTRDDFPRDCGSSTTSFYQPPGNFGKPGEFRTDPELAALIAVLDTVADETVTSAGLRELGVSAATMRRCVIHIGKSTITN